MRNRGTGRLSPCQPCGEEGALAHARAAGDHDPSVGAIRDQELIEPRKVHRSPDEARVSRSFCREVDQPRRFRR
jgi:hypothetical protein